MSSDSSSTVVRCLIDPSRRKHASCEAGGGHHENWRVLCARASLWWRLILHTGILEHVRPFATRALVTVLEMLSEMIRAEELLALVTLAEFVGLVQMFSADVPLWWV
jgi:hypothetical protein